jgi:hypothetical protein
MPLMHEGIFQEFQRGSVCTLSLDTLLRVSAMGSICVLSSKQKGGECSWLKRILSLRSVFSFHDH